MKELKFHVFALMSCFFPLMMQGQDQFAINDYLASSVEDVEMASVNRQGDFLDPSVFRSPWLREIELRTRTNDFNFSQDEFRLRISPINPFEFRANNRYYRSRLNLQESEWTRKLSTVLKARYLNLIDHYYLTSLQRILTETEKAFNDMIRLHLQNTRSLNRSDFIDLDKTHLEIKLDLMKTESRIKEIEAKILVDLASIDQTTWENFPLLTPEQILAHVNDLYNGDVENIHLRYAQHELEVERQRMNVEKSESFSNIAFIQAEYDMDRGDIFDEHMGFQVGIQLPVTNPDRPDLARRKLDLIEEEGQLDEIKKTILLRKELDKLSIDDLNQRLSIINGKQAQLQQIGSTLTPQVELQDWVDLMEYKHDLERMRLELYRNLLERYIFYLDNQGVLASVPLTNYLSATREAVD